MAGQLIKGIIMKLSALAEKNNIQYIEKPNGHIQLKGALLVNYYPKSKDKSAYIDRTKCKVKNVTPEQAIKMCSQEPTNQGVTDKRAKGKSRKWRAAMIRRGITKCCWCDCELTLDTSTIEHVIPLSKGGLENRNNRKLACVKCNNDRGSNMPELLTKGNEK